MLSVNFRKYNDKYLCRFSINDESRYKYHRGFYNVYFDGIYFTSKACPENCLDRNTIYIPGRNKVLDGTELEFTKSQLKEVIGKFIEFVKHINRR